MARNGQVRRRRTGRRVARLATTAVGVTALVAVGVAATPSAASGLWEKMTRFDCIGVPQDFVVPKDVTEITAIVAGASGGGDLGGRGGVVESTLKVTPGEVLDVTAGCRESQQPNVQHGGGYGYAPGGNGGSVAPYGAGSGGGASAVQIGGVNVVVAGGGGGQGASSLGVSGGAGGDGGKSDGANGDGALGGRGGKLGGSATAAGGFGTYGGGAAGGGGGGGFPKGGGGAAHSTFSFNGGGGGGGGENYVDGNPNRIANITQSVGERQAQGSVIFHYGSNYDASPEIFRCTDRIQSYAPWPGQTGIRVTAIGAKGGVVNPDGVSTPTKRGNGDAVAGVIPVHMGRVMDVGVGCQGAPGEYGGAGTDRSPGGRGGFGLESGGSGGQGYRSILDPRGEGGGSGGSGGGGASGVRDSDWAETLLVAAGGGGGGGWGEPVAPFRTDGGDGGHGGTKAGGAGGGLGAGAGGALGGATDNYRGWGGDGGTATDGSLAGGGAGGGGGYPTGGTGGGGGEVGGGGGGGGGGGLSYITNPTITQGRQFDAKSYWQLGNDDGLVIITPVFA
jgi:hypothetical protein